MLFLGVKGVLGGGESMVQGKYGIQLSGCRRSHIFAFSDTENLSINPGYHSGYHSFVIRRIGLFGCLLIQLQEPTSPKHQYRSGQCLTVRPSS